jgi:hypothetical protein
VAAWPGGPLWVSQLQQPEECAFSFFHINRATTDADQLKQLERRNMTRLRLIGALAALAIATPTSGYTAGCEGQLLTGIGGVPKTWSLTGGGLAAYGKMNINIDGYRKAYHPKNFAGGAVIHLCNAGAVFLPDGTNYQGSESNETCTGRFMGDFARIGAANWNDPNIGAINWYGILGTGTATIHGRTIKNVKPVLQKDGSGFYVSPTALADARVTDPSDQSRYVNPLRVPAAVVPQSAIANGAALGTFGVAIDRTRNHAVPFVVGDIGPRIGEGSPALARQVQGEPISDTITRQNRFVGQVDQRDVLWVFFGGNPVAFDHERAAVLIQQAADAFKNWGGAERLRTCLATVPRN